MPALHYRNWSGLCTPHYQGAEYQDKQGMPDKVLYIVVINCYLKQNPAGFASSIVGCCLWNGTECDILHR